MTCGEGVVRVGCGGRGTGAYLAENFVASEIPLLLVLLQVHELDVLPHAHDGLLARGLAQVDHVGELRAELEALRVLVPEQVDGDVCVFLAVALERELVKVGHGRQRGAGGGGRAVGLLPLDAGVDSRRPAPGRRRELGPVKVDRQCLEEVREAVALAGLGGDGLGLGLGGAVRVHLVGVIGRSFVLVGFGFVVVVVEQAAFDLDAVRGLEVGGKVKAVDVEAVGLPELVLDRVGDPDAERLVPLSGREGQRRPHWDLFSSIPLRCG